eukprot:12901606-Prorocentrum_lima.AAC.1
MARSPVSPCVFIESTLTALVSAHASRQPFGVLTLRAIDLEVEDRLGSVRGALREQLLERNRYCDQG